MTEQAAVKVEIVGPGFLLRIIGDDGNVLVQVDDEGNVEYGADYEPDKAAREFWTALGNVPIVRQSLLKRFVGQG